MSRRCAASCPVPGSSVDWIVSQIFEQVVKIHENDQNFPVTVLERMEEFLVNEDVFEHPESHEKLIHEMKVEAALIYNNRWGPTPAEGSLECC